MYIGYAQMFIYNLSLYGAVFSQHKIFSPNFLSFHKQPNSGSRFKSVVLPVA